MKVGFLGVGAQKAGTSALDAYLRAHPALCMARIKEVHFFDDEKAFLNRGPSGFADYHQHFAPQSDTQLAGEVTPSYMYWNDAPRRIWEYNPGMKLVAVLRNPITRAYSQWNMQRDRGRDSLPFWDALSMERERCKAALPFQHRPFSYVDRGFYTVQLQRLWAFFPMEQVLVLRYEDLRDRAAETVGRICDFLGVARVLPTAPRAINVRQYAEPMSEREWSFLRDTFEFEIRALERMLRWDCGAWLRPPEDGEEKG